MRKTSKKENELERSSELTNGLRLEIWNRSRVVAGDRWKIVVIARMEIPLDEKFLPENDSKGAPLSIEEAKGLLGDSVVFEKKIERFFIDENEKDDLKDGLVESLFQSVHPYVSRKKFAGRFIQKEHSEAKKRKHMFSHSD